MSDLFDEPGPEPGASVGPLAEAKADPERVRHLRLIEALLFASDKPLPVAELSERLPEGADVGTLIADLAQHYRHRGINLVEVAGGWAFRTAPDLAAALRPGRTEVRRLSRAAIETLSIIAYHQPTTRGEIEEVRGVAVAKGTLDQILETGWIRPGGRRRTPGRPLSWVTTPAFLDHFGLSSLDDLPGLAELKAAGLLDPNPGTMGISMEGTDLDGETDRQADLLDDENFDDDEDYDAPDDPTQD